MTDQADLLAQFSNALATRAEAAKNAVVAIRLAHERHMTGMVWRPEIVVASEQSLPRKDDFELIGAGGSALTARTAGLHPGSYIPCLRFSKPSFSSSLFSGSGFFSASI